MTKEEAIKHGKEQLEIFWGKNREFAEVATRSLEAWDEVTKDVHDWQEDFNRHVKLLALTDEEKEATMMYGQDVINIIGNHSVDLKEVEETAQPEVIACGEGELKSESQWISCSERLPEVSEYIGDVCKYYLIQDEYGDMQVAHYSRVGWFPIHSIKAIGDEVVAWMPLPEPYKEVEE